MEVIIEIENGSCINLTDGAKDKLEEQTEEYAKNLLREAILIEETDRQEGANSEITSSIIVQAASIKNSKVYFDKYRLFYISQMYYNKYSI